MHSPLQRAAGRTAHRSRYLASAVVVALIATSCGGSDDAEEPEPTTTTTTSTTTTTTTTTTTVPDGPPAPLTGVPVAQEAALGLLRPALAVKIDNHAGALPQAGINQADIVVEIRVEGISRLMGVFHSADADVVGPVRSARYSDPDILAMFGQPLSAWSGANDGVTAAMYRADWVVNVNWDKVARSAYRRRSVHSAPHNLYTSTPTLYEYSRDGQLPPPAQFQFRTTGEESLGTAADGLSVRVGDTFSEWVWDGSEWLRWQSGSPTKDEGGEQVTVQNVVILETRYGSGSRAESVGQGEALVLTDGKVIEANWSRPDRSSQYALTTRDGTPIKLTPGQTWMAMPAGSTAKLLTPKRASDLLGDGR